MDKPSPFRLPPLLRSSPNAAQRRLRLYWWIGMLLGTGWIIGAAVYFWNTGGNPPASLFAFGLFISTLIMLMVVSPWRMPLFSLALVYILDLLMIGFSALLLHQLAGELGLPTLRIPTFGAAAILAVLALPVLYLGGRTYDRLGESELDQEEMDDE